MKEKSIILDEKDKERLREILRQKEAEMDAAELSDEELTAAEIALAQKWKELSAKITPAPESAAEVEQQDKTWQELKSKISQDSQGGQEGEVSGKLIPLFRKPGFSPMWLGLLTVAALALMMILPHKSRDENSEYEDFGVKGSEESLAKVHCEADILSLGGKAYAATPDGLGFQGKIGSQFQMAILCDKDGYLQIDALGPETKTFRNIAVKAGQKTIVNPKSAVFTLPAIQGWNFTLLLTAETLPADLLIPQTANVGEGLGQTFVLWADTLLVREIRE